MKPEIRIGTSGWHYAHWQGNFYPAKFKAAEMLRYYYQHFDSVEINNSFYRLPKPGMFAAWRDCTPPGFIFAVKASRFLTHNKKLKDPENALHNLLPRAEELREKLGPILFQLPPKWRKNTDRLREMLQILPKEHRYAFEFREPSWMAEDVYEVLRHHNAAFCIYELAGYMSPLEVTADFVYVRLHGPGGKYQGSYPSEALDWWARRLLEWRAEGKSVFAYFDNDQAGYAAANAMELKDAIGKLSGPVKRAS